MAEWIQAVSFLPQAPAMVLVLLFFPDGRLPGRRWRAVVWLSILGVVLAEPGWALDPDTGRVFVHGRNPFAVAWLPTDLLFGIGFAAVVASMVGGLIAVIVRFRRSAGVERQQMKWFVFASAVLVVALPVAALLWHVAPVVRVLPPLALTAWPVAVGFAILRYRLYDIDLVISRTITYVLLTAVIGVVFVSAVLLLGTVAGRGSPLATAGATLAATIVFQLLRRRVQDRVDRRFRRARHDALRSVSMFLDSLRTGKAEPEEMTTVLRAALADPALAALRVGARRVPGRRA